MTWTEAKKIIVNAFQQPGVDKRTAEKSSITTEFTAQIIHIAIDAMKLVHASFSNDKNKVIATISRTAAVRNICEYVMEHCENLLEACPYSESLSLVFDGPSSELKQEETRLRYFKAAESQAEAKKQVARLFDGIFESNEREQVLASAVEMAKEGSVLSKDFRDEIACYILHLIDVRRKDVKPIKVFFAPADGEAVLVTLANMLPDVTVFCSDYDCFTHRLSHPWVTEWSIRDSTLSGEYMLRSDTFRSDFLPQCRSVTTRGVFKDFDNFDGLLMTILHVLVGSDFFRWGKRTGLKGMGCKAAIDFVKNCMAALKDAKIRSNRAAFDFCLNAVFQTKQWTVQEQSQEAPREQGQEAILPKRCIDMKTEFKKAVLYFYYGWSVNVRKLGNSLSLANISPDDARISAGFVSAPKDPFADNPHEYFTPKQWTNEDFFGLNHRSSDTFRKVSSSSYISYSDLNVPFLCVLADMQLLASIVRAMGHNPHPSLDRNQLVGIIKSTEANILREKLRSTEQTVVAAPLIDTSKYFELGDGKAIQGCEEILGFIRSTISSCPELPLHVDLHRAGLPDGSFSTTDAVRMIRLVFGHVSLHRMEVYPAAKLTCSSSREYPPSIFLFLVRGIVPSMKTCITYDVYIPFVENFHDVDEFWCQRESLCTCVAGNSTCSHKRAAVLYIGVLAQLIVNGFENDEIIAMLPADVLDIQSRPISLGSYFRAPDDLISVRTTKKGRDAEGNRLSEESVQVNDLQKTNNRRFGVNDSDSDSDANTNSSEVQTPDEVESKEVEAFIASTNPGSQSDSGQLKPRLYHGNILSDIVEVITNSKRMAGFPSVFYSAAAASDSINDRLNLVSSSDIDVLRPYVIRTLILCGAAKLPV